MSSDETQAQNTRPLEQEIHKDLRASLSYGEYLRLDDILGAQHLMSLPQHHDEMLFIIQHQTSELWLKLMLHELQAVRANMRAGELAPAFKMLARVARIM